MTPLGATPKLLLVDDTPENLEILQYMLEPRGYEILQATDGPSALGLVASEDPDLVLLDVMMPGMDGFEVCRRLREDPETAGIPVIFLSALHSNEWKIKGFEAGSVDCVSKPFQINEVLARVEAHVRLRFALKALENTNGLLREEIEQRKLAEAALADANRRLAELAAEDGLTKLANRRRLDQQLDVTWRQMAREKQPMAVILADIDQFKLYNDHYGHQGGDACLRAVAQAFGGVLKRPADLAGRFGGEEFMAILSNTDLAGATVVAEEIGRMVRALELPHASSTVSDHVTLSLGVASGVPTPQGNLVDLIAVADEALYQAKAEGRARAVGRPYEPSGSAPSLRSQPC